MDSVRIERVFTMDSEALEQISAFLKGHGLALELPTDVLLSGKSEDKIVATGALRGQIIKMLAVDESFRGSNLIGKMISEVMGQAFQMGQDHLFIYTKPGNETTFGNLGFYKICETDYVALFENRKSGIEKFFETAAERSDVGGTIGSVVVNCNPFTLGHQYLIETAAGEVDHLFVFVVSEDLSTFPAKDRLELVRAGTDHLENVTVLESGPYMVSSATFPSYFLDEGNDKVDIHTEVDATVFAQRIARHFGITKRFLGEEPYSPTTEAYNRTLRKVLSQYEIEVKIIPRKAVEGEIVSASKVRRFIGMGELEKALEFVPKTTKAYLLSEAAADVIERIKREAHLAKRI